VTFYFLKISQVIVKNKMSRFLWFTVYIWQFYRHFVHFASQLLTFAAHTFGLSQFHEVRYNRFIAYCSKDIFESVVGQNIIDRFLFTFTVSKWT